MEQNKKLDEQKLTDVGHEYYSQLLAGYTNDNIDDYAYHCAYCMSHDWAAPNPTWEDIEKACKLGALWQQSQDQSKLKKRMEEEFKDLFRKHYENGRNSMKQEMLESAVEREVKVDSGGYPYIDATELYDYDKDEPLAKAGDRIKIIIIYED